MPSPKKVAVIGAGVSGILSIASLKEEGFDPICFEKTADHGGTWCYREESVIGIASTMPTTIINHSKEMGALSNFPPDKECSNYMNKDQLYKYILSYANKNDVLKHIRYNSQVTELKRSDDYEETGRWIVTVKDTVSNLEHTETFDLVTVCVGHINTPKWPSYEDQEIYKGEMMHTHSLKGTERFKDKNVVVVGMGCSGLDAAVEISNVAKQVYLSTKSGAHVFSRVGLRGYPLDYVLLRRYITILIDIFPSKYLSWLLENIMLDSTFNHRLYAVEPEWHILSKDPVFNDHIASKLLSGSVIQTADISKFTDNGVKFNENKTEIEADAVIMATGYTMGFPFLEKDINIIDGDYINLYKCIWPTQLKHQTLAFVGFFLPFGPGFPLAEIQSRWVAHIFAEKNHLPSKDKMDQDVKNRYAVNNARYAPCAKQNMRVDYTQYLDEIAKELGVMPNFLKICVTDPKLFHKLVFGPSVSYQYRLQGPHSWEGAREAIMKCEERVNWPLKRKEIDKIESSFGIFWKKFLYWIIPVY